VPQKRVSATKVRLSMSNPRESATNGLFGGNIQPKDRVFTRGGCLGTYHPRNRRGEREFSHRVHENGLMWGVPEKVARHAGSPGGKIESRENARPIRPCTPVIRCHISRKKKNDISRSQGTQNLVWERGRQNELKHAKHSGKSGMNSGALPPGREKR